MNLKYKNVLPLFLGGLAAVSFLISCGSEKNTEAKKDEIKKRLEFYRGKRIPLSKDGKYDSHYILKARTDAVDAEKEDSCYG